MTTLVPKTSSVIASVVFVLVITLVGIFAPLLASHDPREVDVLKGVQRIGPFETWENPLGVDILGRDMLSRLVYGLRIPVILGGAAVLLGTISSLVLVGLGASSRVFKNTGQLPSEGFLSYSLLRTAGPILLIGAPSGLSAAAALGSGLLTVALVVIPFAAIAPLSLIYWSVRSKLALSASREWPTSTGENTPGLPVRIASRECLILLPVTYSLAFLTGLLPETQLSFLGAGVPPGEPSLGIMIAQGRNNLIDLWWLSLLPLGVVALSVVAFLGIVLPIRRVQKQSDLFVQPESMVMIYAGFWDRMFSIAVDLVALILIGIIVGIPLSFDLPQLLFDVILVAFEGVYTLFFWEAAGIH